MPGEPTVKVPTVHRGSGRMPAAWREQVCALPARDWGVTHAGSCEWIAVSFPNLNRDDPFTRKRAPARPPSTPLSPLERSVR